jgi:hypothetical protein
MNGALARQLSNYRGQTLATLSANGDRGDALVHRGADEFFRTMGATIRDYRITDDLSQMHGDVLLIFGAGTLMRRKNPLLRQLAWITPRFAEVVLLPSSYDLDHPRVRSFARSWDQRYTVFCRELISFDSLRPPRVKPKAILLGHDLAFHVDVRPWAEKRASGRAGIFRHDEEAASGGFPRDLDDYNDVALGSDRDPDPMLDYIARHAEIHTDRCHVAIAAAMMRRTVVFYQNSYFKNRAIYDHSLAGQPHVTFVNRAPFSLKQYLRAAYWRRFPAHAA